MKDLRATLTAENVIIYSDNVTQPFYMIIITYLIDKHVLLQITYGVTKI